MQIVDRTGGGSRPHGGAAGAGGSGLRGETGTISKSVGAFPHPPGGRGWPKAGRGFCLKTPPLILASASPRRAALLRHCGLEFQIVPVGVREIEEKHLSAG